MNRALIVAAAAVAFVPFAAVAQTTQTTTTTYENPEQFNPGSRPSLGILGEGGISDYSQGPAAESTPGAGYGARVDFSPARNVGLEAAYNGAINDLASRFSANGQIISNMVGGDLRINLVPPNYDLPGDLKPFIFGGVAYNDLGVKNFTPGITSGNLLAVPVGGGLEADLGDHFLIGARYSYNFLFNDTAAFAGRTAAQWFATVDLGARIQ